MTPSVPLVLFALSGACWASCVPVSGERILARDLAQASPVFAGIPPEFAIGFAPPPGGRRTFSSVELSRLARRYGLAEPAESACFSRPVQTLTSERLAAVLQASLPGARIEILDFSRQPVPMGELYFPLSGLASTGPADSAQMWRGHAGGEGGLAVWVKVRLRIRGTRAVAVEDLPAGQIIERAQIHVEDFDGPPVNAAPSEIVGRIPRSKIRAGAVIEPRFLEEPPPVAHGSRVRVEVFSGEAHLLLDGQAQAAGRLGDTIPVRNPATGRIFRARVVAAGRVSLAAGKDAPLGGTQ